MIALNEVSKKYSNASGWAVRGINLTIGEGEFVVILGESGCGKTTTLKMINRLVDLTSGTIEVNGQDIMSVSPIQLRRQIGYVFQAIGLFPHLTVAQNIAAVPRLLGWNRTDIDNRVCELLKLVELDPDEYASRLPRELSGGQQQRIGFARALAARPELMLMDEPFGALDPITRDHLQTQFKELQTKLGLTVVMVTHDVTEAIILADRIAVLKDGGVVFDGTPRQMLTDPGGGYVTELIAKPKNDAARLMRILSGEQEN